MKVWNSTKRTQISVSSTSQRDETHSFLKKKIDDVYVSVSKARLHPGSTQRGSKHITDDIDDADDHDNGDDNHDDNLLVIMLM